MGSNGLLEKHPEIVIELLTKNSKHAPHLLKNLILLSSYQAAFEAIRVVRALR